MTSPKSVFSYLAAFLVGGALVGQAFLHPSQSYAAPGAVLLSPPENLKYFLLGYNETVADTLWLRAIQDLDICEQAGVSAHPTVKSLDPGTPAPKVIKCNKGWPFRMMYAMTEVAPRFQVPYTLGAITLSVVGEDKEGASILFDRGLERIHNDWNFVYKAAYHFMIEVGDVDKASKLLVRAGKEGAPLWVYSLAAKLSAKEGQVALAESVLKEQIDNAKDERVREFFRRRLDDIRSGKTREN